MAIFSSDTFTGTSGTNLTAHTGETGATWQKMSGWPEDILLSNANRILYSGSSAAVYYSSGTPSGADYDVEADFVVVAAIGGQPGIAGRVGASGTTWYWLRYNSTATAWELYAGASLLGSYSQSLSAGNTYHAKLSLNGTSIKGYVDGVERISATNGTYSAAGKAGVICGGGAGTVSDSTGIHIDNFVATDPSVGGTFSISPSTIPANHAGNITLTLTGTSTSWDGTTVFTPSGVANVVKVSQNVTSSTAATVVVTTGAGAGTGTCTITESVTGSGTNTVTVATASISASPNTGQTGGSSSVTFTGSNTLWSADNPTLQISGGTGASIGSTTVNSNTSATASVTYGSAAGTLTVTDPSTTATCSITVTAADKKIVFDGNSLSDSSYPTTVGTILGSTWLRTNFAVSAQTTEDMLDDAVAQVDAAYDGTKTINVLVAWEITNDLYFGASATDAYNRYVQYCSDRQNAGYKVVAVSVLPRSEVGTPGSHNADRQTCNTNLRANWRSYADAFVDIAADSRFADSTNSTYFSDLVHLTSTGYGIVADYVAGAVLALANPGGTPPGGGTIFVNGGIKSGSNL